MPKRIPILFILTLLVFGVWTSKDWLPMFSRASTEEKPKVHVSAPKLLALAPIDRLKAEEAVASGKDFLAGPAGVKGDFGWESEVRVVTLTDELGACVPSEYGPFSEKLAANLRKYKIQFVYLPHSSCKPTENIPASLGGFVDLSAAKLEVRPYLNIKIAEDNVILVHIPDASYTQTREKIFGYIAAYLSPIPDPPPQGEGNKKATHVVTWQYEHDGESIKKAVEAGSKMVVVVKAPVESADMQDGSVFVLDQNRILEIR